MPLSLSLSVREVLRFSSFPAQETKKKDEPKELPELVYPGISEYPAIEARPPQPTAFEVPKFGGSQGLRCAILFLGRILAFEKKISLFLGFLPQILLFQLVFHLPMGWW